MLAKHICVQSSKLEFSNLSFIFHYPILYYHHDDQRILSHNHIFNLNLSLHLRCFSSIVLNTGLNIGSLVGVIAEKW